LLKQMAFLANQLECKTWITAAVAMLVRNSLQFVSKLSTNLLKLLQSVNIQKRTQPSPEISCETPREKQMRGCFKMRETKVTRRDHYTAPRHEIFIRRHSILKATQSYKRWWRWYKVMPNPTCPIELLLCWKQ
jgi:hypothetical protein